ncbi:MAG: c-type cytochrome [Candidatus Binataceae bacterium]
MISRNKWLVPMFALLLIGSLTRAETGNVEQGQAVYSKLCASCHGPTGAGDGPVASSLSTRPVDLRLLSSRYGNPLNANEIARFIDGRTDVRAHGPRDMPVWGEDAWGSSTGKGSQRVKSWVAEVVAYIESIQTRKKRR